MRKYKLILLALVFVLGLFIFSAKPANALIAGCASTSGFSTTTGESCGNSSTYPSGCTSTSGFSTMTGEPCSVSEINSIPIISSINTSSSNIGDLVYVYGSNFDKSAFIVTYSSVDGSQVVAPANFISSNSLSFIVPSNAGSGLHSIQIQKSPTNLNLLSNIVNFVFTTPITSTIDHTTENLLFVIPKSFATGSYSQKIKDYVSDLNVIYSKNTIKRFALDEIRTYNDTVCTAYDCIIGDSAFYKLNTLPVIFLSTGSSYASGVPRPNVVLTWRELPVRDINSSVYKNFISTFAHELGHTNGAGLPELYSNQGNDTTNIEPILKTYNTYDVLPERFRSDPMFQNSFGLESFFSSLSKTIINKNATDLHDYSSLFSSDATATRNFYYYSMPSVKLKVQNSNGAPISNAEIKVYCIDSYFTNNANKLLETTKTDQNGTTNIRGPFMSENNGTSCFVIAMKVYAEGYSAKAVPLTFAELQEAKIVNNLKVYEMNNVQLLSNNSEPLTALTVDLKVNGSDYPSGCTSSFGYSMITGLACNNSTQSPVSTVPGCSSTSSFSITTGQLCGGNTNPSSTYTPSSTSPSSCTINSTLRLGSTGADVACLQTRLGISADGKFGPRTLIIVKAFQSNAGLVADGVVGPRSISALEVSN